MSYSNYLEAAVLDHLFDESAYTAPTWYVALSTADPTEDGSGIAEPVGNGYTRIALGATTRTVSEVVNDAAVTFAEASGSWGTISHIAFFDAASAGNFLGSNALDSSLAVGSGDTARFPAGDITVTQG